MITRRRFLGSALLGAAGAALPGCRGRPARRERPPNLLLIMSDEHAAAVTGCYGDAVVRTPHLDRLASDGVLLEDVYAPSPLCAPSRMAFLAGKIVSRIGAWSNTSWLPADDYPTLARLLATAHCETWLGGKMHLDRTRRYGFTEVFTGRFNQRDKSGLVERVHPDAVQERRRQWRRRVGPLEPVERSEVLDWDLRLTEETIGFLRARKRDDGPFLLVAGYYAPHYPLHAPAAFLRALEGRVPDPDIPDGYLETLPTNYRVFRRQGGAAELDAASVRRARELYWARVGWMDAQVGRVLDALDGSRVAEDTVVVYTSDHGENKGDHGLWWKNCMFDPAVKVPLLVRWPERWDPGQRRAGACSLIDLSATLVDLAGGAVPADWDGVSLVPWLDDPASAWKDRAVSEYYGSDVASGFAMVRAGRHKYVYHTRIDERFGPERELYDLVADPGELVNLASRPEEARRLTSLHRTLVEELGRDPEACEAQALAETRTGYGRELSSGRQHREDMDD